MKIALLTETFHPEMGYIQNLLPQYLARHGADVHVLSMDLPVYHHFAEARELGSSVLPASSVERLDGFTLHVLGHRRVFGYMRMRGLLQKLSALRPEVVQTLAAIGWIPLDAAVGKVALGYKLFTGSHTAASCYPPAQPGYRCGPRDRAGILLTRTLPGRAVSLLTSKCYAPTSDCGEIAWRFFGVEKPKVDVMHLGVDTLHFHPAQSEADFEERRDFRLRIGLAEEEIACIYTGKLIRSKKSFLLADAVEYLNAAGGRYRALFIGNGPREEELRKRPGCMVLPFRPHRQLASCYRASDIGVWPGNESISMLDAAACGLPLVISDEVHYREHVDGNGMVFRRDSVADLTRCLRLLGDAGTRAGLGLAGAAKMSDRFSWDSVALRRMSDYRDALGRPRVTEETAPASTAGQPERG